MLRRTAVDCDERGIMKHDIAGGPEARRRHRVASAAASSLRLGGPADDGVEMGPLIVRREVFPGG